MDYNLKEYQILKTKKNFKNNNLFFIYHSPKLHSKDWIKIEQKLKKLKIKHYKIFNGITKKVIKNSIYKNYYNTISGLILIIKPKYKLTEIKLENIKKELKTLFVLFSIKCNNNIYTVSQVSNLKIFSYNNETFSLHKILEKSIKKISYTFKNNSKQCDLNT